MSDIYNVLLVEDSEDDVFFFARALRRLPEFRLAGCAGNGDAAIAYLKGEGEFGDRKQYPWPDIVVLDLKTPGQDGFSLLEWLSKQARRPKVGVFTGSEKDRIRVEQLGGDLYQVKTFEEKEFGRFMHWLSRLADGDRKDKDQFQQALIGALLIEVLAHCA
jgi:DNA-binding response OmpR family regulator